MFDKTYRESVKKANKRTTQLEPLYEKYLTTIARCLNDNGEFQSKDLESMGLKASTASKYIKRLLKNKELELARKTGLSRVYRLPVVELPVIEDTANYSEGVLQYASDHIGQRYSVSQMAKDLNIPIGSIYQVVYALQKRNLLDNSFNLGGEKVEATPTSVEAQESTPSTFIDDVDGFVWMFIKASGSVNVLEFLKYLKEM